MIHPINDPLTPPRRPDQPDVLEPVGGIVILTAEENIVPPVCSAPTPNDNESESVLEKTKHAAQDVVNRVEQAAGQAWDSTREEVQEVAGRLERTAEQTWDSTQRGARDLADRMERNARTVWHDVDRWVRRHPEPALLIGFAAGFLLWQAFEYAIERRRS